MKKSLSTKIFGIIAIVVLILTAMAPVFYAFAPQYIPEIETSPVAERVDVESITTE